MQNIVVTGAGKGIGMAICELLLQKYPDTKIMAVSRDCSRLEKNRLQYRDRLFLEQANLLDSLDDFTGIAKSVKDNLGCVHVLINNAGLFFKQPLGSWNVQQIREMFDLNAIVPAFLIRALMPFFDKKERGHIVNISSMGGLQGTSKYPGMLFYSASKAALAVLTECLAEELKEQNISVNCLAPGAVQTEMLEEAFPGYKAPVSPDEMAAFITSFALGAGKLMNGKIIPVSLSVP